MEDSQNQESQTSQGISNGVSFPTVGETKKAGNTKTLLIVGILVLVAILGFVIYKSASSKSEDVITESTNFEDLVTPSSEQVVETTSPKPSATSSAKVDKSKVEIQIQNGTGITGDAAFLQTQLSALGYKNIKVGNSDSTVTATVVTFSDTLDSGVVSEITQKLNTLYQTVTSRTSQSATYDVVILTGIRKGTTPKPEASGLPSATSTPKSSPKPTATATATP